MTEQYQCKYRELCLKYAVSREECNSSDAQFCSIRKKFERELALKKVDEHYKDLEKYVEVFR